MLKLHPNRAWLPVLVPALMTAALVACEAVDELDELDELDLEIVDRIEEGTVVTADELEADFQDSIVYLGGGSGLLIAPRLVLTAAHAGNDQCDENSTQQGKVVKIGVSGELDTVDMIKEIDTVDYGACVNKNHDYGAWVLERPFKDAIPYTDFAGPVEIGKEVQLYGFGSPNDGTLQKTTKGDCTVVKKTSSDYFGRLFYYRCTSGQISDSGDSGGPVFDENLNLVGVNVGRVLHEGEVVSLAVDIAAYADWVDDVIEKYKTEVVTGDFDGDGRDDLFYWNTAAETGNWVDLSAGSYPDGIQDESGDDLTRWCAQELFVGTFNDDGRDDLLCFDDEGDRMWIDYANTAGQFNGGNWAASHAWCDGELQLGDFNGDGLSDLFCRDDSGPRKVDINDGTSVRFSGADWSGITGWCAQDLHVGDFDGDGRDDLLCHKKGQGMWVRTSSPTGTFVSGHTYNATTFCSGQDDVIHVADVSGDGIDDLTCWNQESDTIAIDYAAANGFPFTGADWEDPTFYWCGQTASLADFNGDGKSDLLCHKDETGQLWIDLYDDTSKFDSFASVTLP